jgi:hypothetical protein
MEGYLKWIAAKGVKASPQQLRTAIECPSIRKPTDVRSRGWILLRRRFRLSPRTLPATEQTPSATNQSPSRTCVSSRTTSANEKAAPIAESGRLEFQRLAFIVDLVGFFLPLSFSPGSCTREEGFMVTLTINKDDP